jgi:hypothetical protein
LNLDIIGDAAPAGLGPEEVVTAVALALAGEAQSLGEGVRDGVDAVAGKVRGIRGIR